MEFAHKEVEKLPLENLSIQQFLALAIETSNLMGWVFGDINQMGFIAYTANGMFSWNAEIKLRIRNGMAIIQSESRGNNLIDLRENKKNIQLFISSFKDLKRSVTPEELIPIYENLKANFL